MPDERTHEKAVGIETEIGGTKGEEHDAILQRVLGHERGLDVAVRDGPPRVPARKARKEEREAPGTPVRPEGP